MLCCMEVIIKWNVVLEKKRDGNFEKIRKIDDLNDVLCEAIDRRNCENLMDMLGIEESLDRMAKSSSMQYSTFMFWEKKIKMWQWRLWNLKSGVVEEEDDRNKPGKICRGRNEDKWTDE